MRSHVPAPFFAPVALAVLACVGTTAESEPTSVPRPQAVDAAPPPVTPASSTDEQLRPLVREIAAAYRSWGMVDDQLHWAPGLCALPASGIAHYSSAQPPGAHAEKVFLLYASDAMGYWRAAGIDRKLPSSLGERHALSSRADVLQVLVKESFVPAKVGEGRPFGPHGVRAASKDGQSFLAGDPIGLFVMAQLDGRPAGTDDGWIYATVAPQGEIAELGVIASCRDCHAKEADRVFGVPLAWK